MKSKFKRVKTYVKDHSYEIIIGGTITFGIVAAAMHPEWFPVEEETAEKIIVEVHHFSH